MSARREQMTRLFTLARRAPRTAANASPPEMSHGFATRVAARWAAGEGGVPPADIWEKLCWRGAAAAAAVCLVAFLHSAQKPSPTAFELLLQAPMSDSANVNHS